MSKNDIRTVTHIMVDIETTDTKPTSRILSIGAVAFKLFAPMPAMPTTVGFDDPQRFYAVASESSQTTRSVSIATMGWWATQPKVVGDEAFSGTADLHDVLMDFVAWANNIEGEKLFWCKGTDFDFAIIAHALDSYGIKHPWMYFQLRDCRTAFSIMPQVVETCGVNPNAHNAFADAMHQARVLHKVLYSAVNAPTLSQSFDC